MTDNFSSFLKSNQVMGGELFLFYFSLNRKSLFTAPLGWSKTLFWMLRSSDHVIAKGFNILTGYSHPLKCCFKAKKKWVTKKKKECLVKWKGLRIPKHRIQFRIFQQYSVFELRQKPGFYILIFKATKPSFT